jgi:hypothetical protein
MMTGSFVILKRRGKKLIIQSGKYDTDPFDIRPWCTKQKLLSENSWSSRLKNDVQTEIKKLSSQFNLENLRLTHA